MRSPAPSGPPRAATRPPKYRLHKASGRAMVQFGGRRLYLGRHGSPESLRRYAVLLAELAEPGRQASPTTAAIPRAPGDGPTAVELVALYWDFAQDYYSKRGRPTKTVEQLRFGLRLLREQYGDLPAVEFGPSRLLALRDRMAESGLSRSTVNKRIGYVKRLFKWGVSRELLPPAVHQALSTVEGLRRGRSKARDPKPIPPVEDAAVEYCWANLKAARIERYLWRHEIDPGSNSALSPVPQIANQAMEQYPAAEADDAADRPARKGLFD